jgi:Phosphatidylinositol-glycan biosynthesis class S protein
LLVTLIQTCAALHSSAFNVALRHSSLALEYAEKAFFDDKMVSMLYFPDEHKYAIYTPLFGPLALPLVMALLKELQGIFKRWKAMRLKVKTGADALIAKGGDGESLVMATTTEPMTE